MLPNHAQYEGHTSPKSQGKYLAERFREQHQLASGPVEHIELLTELVNADLLITKLPDTVDALTVRDPATQHIVIGVSTSTVPYRQNFSLAHEVGHVYAGDLSSPAWVNPCHDHDAEKRANSFAAHVLCPLDSLEVQLEGHDPYSEEALSHLVQRFKVSPTVAIDQLRRSGLINPEQSIELGSKKWTAPKLASRFGWREAYNMEVVRSSTPRPAPRLAADATEAYLKGLVSAEAVALARGITPQEVKEELDGFKRPNTDSTDAPLSNPFTSLDDFFGGG